MLSSRGCSLRILATNALCRGIARALDPLILSFINQLEGSYDILKAAVGKLCSEIPLLPSELLQNVLERLDATCNIGYVILSSLEPVIIDEVKLHGHTKLLLRFQMIQLVSNLAAGLRVLNTGLVSVDDSFLQALSESAAAGTLEELICTTNDFSDSSAPCWPLLRSLRRLKMRANGDIMKPTLMEIAKIPQLAFFEVDDWHSSPMQHLSGLSFLCDAYQTLLAEGATAKLQLIDIFLWGDPLAQVGTAERIGAVLLSVLPRRFAHPTLLRHIALPRRVFKVREGWELIKSIGSLCPDLNLGFSVREPSAPNFESTSLIRTPPEVLRNIKNLAIGVIPELDQLAPLMPLLETLRLAGQDFPSGLSLFTTITDLFVDSVRAPTYEEFCTIPTQLTSLSLRTTAQSSECADPDLLVEFLCSNLCDLKQITIRGPAWKARHVSAVFDSLPLLEQVELLANISSDEVVSGGTFEISSTKLTRLPIITQAFKPFVIKFYLPNLKEIKVSDSLIQLDLLHGINTYSVPNLASFRMQAPLFRGAPDNQTVSHAIEELSRFTDTLESIWLSGHLYTDQMQRLVNLSSLRTLSQLRIDDLPIPVDLARTLIQSCKWLEDLRLKMVDIVDTNFIHHPLLRRLVLKLEMNPRHFEAGKRIFLIFEPARLPHLTSVSLNSLSGITPTAVTLSNLVHLQSLSLTGGSEAMSLFVTDCPILKKLTLDIHEADEIRIQGCQALKKLDFCKSNLTRALDNGLVSILLPKQTFVVDVKTYMSQDDVQSELDEKYGITRSSSNE